MNQFRNKQHLVYSVLVLLLITTISSIYLLRISNDKPLPTAANQPTMPATQNTSPLITSEFDALLQTDKSPELSSNKTTHSTHTTEQKRTQLAITAPQHVHQPAPSSARTRQPQNDNHATFSSSTGKLAAGNMGNNSEGSIADTDPANEPQIDETTDLKKNGNENKDEVKLGEEMMDTQSETDSVLAEPDPTTTTDESLPPSNTPIIIADSTPVSDFTPITNNSTIPLTVPTGASSAPTLTTTLPPPLFNSPPNTPLSNQPIPQQKTVSVSEPGIFKLFAVGLLLLVISRLYSVHVSH